MTRGVRCDALIEVSTALLKDTSVSLVEPFHSIASKTLFLIAKVPLPGHFHRWDKDAIRNAQAESVTCTAPANSVKFDDNNQETVGAFEQPLFGRRSLNRDGCHRWQDGLFTELSQHKRFESNFKGDLSWLRRKQAPKHPRWTLN